MTEAEIRDYVADHLDIIEPGLELIAKEYAIPNALGASGRVDILARDRFRNFVVIELKKSDSTARSALHELLKYLALLQSEKGIPQAKLRCILLSTDWHELLIPFSELVNTSPFSLEGRRIRFDAGPPDTTEPVVPIRKCEGVTFPTEFYWLTFSTLEDREMIADRLKALLTGIGLKNGVFVEMTSLNPSHVCFPFSLALPFFELSRDDALALLSQSYFPVNLLPEYGDLEDVCNGDLETLRDAVLGSVQSQIFCFNGVQDVHHATCSSFAAERDFWKVDSIYRMGPAVSDRNLLSDDDILASMYGFAQGNEEHFVRAVDPSHKMQFEEFENTLRKFLTRYGWWDEVKRWLDVVTPVQGTTVVADAYCPRALLKHLALFLKAGDESWLPAFNALLVRPPHHAQLHGCLAWDGTTSPPIASSALPDWNARSAAWCLLRSDRKDVDAILRAYGLVFPIVSWTPDHGTVASTRFVSMTQWRDQYPDAAEDLATRLGPIVTF